MICGHVAIELGVNLVMVRMVFEECVEIDRDKCHDLNSGGPRKECAFTKFRPLPMLKLVQSFPLRSYRTPSQPRRKCCSLASRKWRSTCGRMQMTTRCGPFDTGSVKK